MAKTAQVATKNEKNVVKGNKKKESANVPAMKAKKPQAARVGILKNNIDAKILQPEKNGKKNVKDDDEDDSGESLETPNDEESNDIDNSEMGSNSDDVENGEDSEDAQQSHDEESDEDDDGDEVDDDGDEVDGDGDEVDEDDDEADEEEEGSDNEGPEEITAKQEKNVRDVPDKNYIKNEDLKRSRNKSNKNRKIFINGLKNSITVDQISKHFVSCGKIELVQILQKGKRAEAVVVFEDESASKSALKLHSSILDDGNISVRHSNTFQPASRNSVVVLNPEGLTKLEPSKLENVLSKCGEIQELTIVCTPKTLAFVDFKNPESVSKALELDGTEQNGLQLKIAPYTIKNGKTKIFVKNLERGTTEDQLRDLFETCGPISNISLKKNDALPSTAIINFENSDSYCQSFLLHEQNLRGRPILLEPFSENMKKSKQFSSKSFTENVNYRGPNKFSKNPFNGKRPHTGMRKKEFPPHTGMWKKEFPPQKRFKN